MKTSLMWILPPRIRSVYSELSTRSIREIEVSSDRVRVHFHPEPNAKVVNRVDLWKMGPHGWYLVTQKPHQQHAEILKNFHSSTIQ